MREKPKGDGVSSLESSSISTIASHDASNSRQISEKQQVLVARQQELPLFSSLSTGTFGGRAGKADGRQLDQRNGTRYIEMTCRSVLNWVEGSRMSNFYSLNPYRGCEFGCVYCYARYTHEYFEKPAWQDFEQEIFVKINAPEALNRDLRRKHNLNKGIHIGSATDPYQPAEQRFCITRKLLERMLHFPRIPLTIISKSSLIARDAELLEELSHLHDVTVILSCITLDNRLQRSLEPRAHVPEMRLRAMELLAKKGVRTGLLMAPILPGINDKEEEIFALLKRAKEAGISHMMYQALFLPAASKRRFFPWLKQHLPAYYERYVKAYSSGQEFGQEIDASAGSQNRSGDGNSTRSISGRLPEGGEYRTRLRARMHRLRKEVGLPDEK